MSEFKQPCFECGKCIHTHNRREIAECFFSLQDFQLKQMDLSGIGKVRK